MKVAFLACKTTLPGAPDRRSDAFEHDYQFSEISRPLRAEHIEFIAVDWRDDVTDWNQFAAAIIGTTWDYWDYPAEFLAKLTSLSRKGVKVFNPPELVAWNMRKTYLEDLAARGARIIPTLWPSHPDAAEIRVAFDTLGTDDIVIKRQIGAGAFDQRRYKRGDLIVDYPFDAMIQPFIPAIQTEGEYSFIMIDGDFSHALLKEAKSGDYRIQSMYGGRETRIKPGIGDLTVVQSVMNCLDSAPLYARVDMVRLPDGELGLIELELIEPYLYPKQAENLGNMICQALMKRLK